MLPLLRLTTLGTETIAHKDPEEDLAGDTKDLEEANLEEANTVAVATMAAAGAIAHHREVVAIAENMVEAATKRRP